MKTTFALLGHAARFTGSELAERYTLDWYKIAGGGRIIDLPHAGAPLTNAWFFFTRV